MAWQPFRAEGIAELTGRIQSLVLVLVLAQLDLPAKRAVIVVHFVFLEHAGHGTGNERS